MRKVNIILVGLSIVSMSLAGCGNKPHEHIWGTTTYTWADDYSSCTAERMCFGDASHKETETKVSVYTTQTPAGCETEGQGRYTVTFENIAFETQIHDVVLNPIDHNWGTPTFEWSVDYSQCTATRECLNDSNHIETETVNSTYQEITPATEEAEGLGRYTAIFTKTAFVTQTYDITLNKLYYGKTPILSEDGKTLTYGLYPQKNANDSSLVSALNALTTPESNGWYLYDNDYYAKVSATPYIHNSDYVFDNGTTIVSGTTYWFKCEPITWNVLSNTNGEYYIISSALLDAHCYYNSRSLRTIDSQTVYANNYKYSDIRTWLNEDFYNSAFALNDSYIQTTTVDNSATTTNSTSNSYACANTEDKVFLPSYQDYVNSSYGFSTSSTRACKTTDWARAKGARYLTDSSYLYNGWYWTRSPHSDYKSETWVVNSDGRPSGAYVNYNESSVRPAIKIKIA